MFSIQQIKTKARNTLNATPGIYLLPIIPVLLNVIVQLLSTVSTQSDLTFLLQSGEPLTTTEALNQFSFPLLYATLQEFLFLSVSLTLFRIIYYKKEKTGLADAFAIFNHPHFWKIVKTFFLKELFLFLWGLITGIGFSLLIIGLALSFVWESSAWLFIILGFFVMIAGIALWIPQNLAYSLVPLILFEQLEKEKYTGAYAIIKESRRLMKGYKFKAFVLNLSFIGWNLLVYLTMGVVGIYVYPYFLASQIHFYQAVLDDREMKEKLYMGMMG